MAVEIIVTIFGVIIINTLSNIDKNINSYVTNFEEFEDKITNKLERIQMDIASIEHVTMMTKRQKIERDFIIDDPRMYEK